MRKVLILPSVLMDLADAAAWYDREGHAGLGNRFINTFYASLAKIVRIGDSSRMVYRDFRKIVIRPFPYSVYFRLHEERWIVTLVIHSARRPGLVSSILQERK